MRHPGPINNAHQLRVSLHWLLLVVGATLSALLPRRAWAACGPTDLGACAANAQYGLWYTVASWGWWFDSALLVLAYQLDALRAWIVEVVFAGAYTALTQLVNPLVVPAALIAATVALLAFWLTPLLGSVRLVSLRQVILWAMLAPLLLTAGGSFMVQLDAARVGVATSITQSVTAVAQRSTPLFGARGSDMWAVRPVYPSDPCGTGTLRQSAASGIADLAFAFSYADTGDAFCAAARGPSRDIPDGLYLTAPDGPGFAFDGTVGDLEEPQRSDFVNGIQRGATRLWMGVIPAAIAVCDTLIQLLFSLALVMLWVILPFALVVVFFQQDGGAIALLAKRAVIVLQVSWSTTFVLSFVAVGLAAAGALNNAVAFVGFAIGAGFFYLFGAFVAILTVKDALSTLHDAFAIVTGISVSRTAGAMTETAAGGAAVVAGGLGVAAGAALLLAAPQSSASSTSSSSAINSSTTNVMQTLIVMQVGDVGRAEGWANAAPPPAAGPPPIAPPPTGGPTVIEM